MAITHTYVSPLPDDGSDRVGSNEWNASHTIAAGSIVLADLASNSVNADKIVDGSITQVNLEANSLDGTVVENGTAAYTNGIIPLLYRIDLSAAGTLATVTVTHKIFIVDYWFIKIGDEPGDAAFTVTYKNAGTAVAYLVVGTSQNSNGCMTRDVLLTVPAQQTVAAGAALGVSASGGTDMAGQCYVLAYRVA